MLDSTAVELPGGGGYKYFGCAKDLPGVRELFQKPTPYEPKKSRSELYRIVNFEYYGFAAHNDKELLEEEKRLEAEAHV
jgi:pre-mRNA-splicing factor ISY1